MNSPRRKIQRLNHIDLQNTVHFDTSTLSECLQRGDEKSSIRMAINDVQRGWSNFQSAVIPLLANFIHDCGPSTSLRYLFACYKKEEADWFLDNAQAHWIERHHVQEQLDSISVTIDQISIAIDGIESCQSLTADCNNIVRLDSLLATLSEALSNLPPEESI